jgi:hypothetical protein
MKDNEYSEKLKDSIELLIRYRRFINCAFELSEVDLNERYKEIKDRQRVFNDKLKKLQLDEQSPKTKELYRKLQELSAKYDDIGLQQGEKTKLTFLEGSSVIDIADQQSLDLVKKKFKDAFSNLIDELSEELVHDKSLDRLTSKQKALRASAFISGGGAAALIAFIILGSIPLIGGIVGVVCLGIAAAGCAYGSKPYADLAREISSRVGNNDKAQRDWNKDVDSILKHVTFYKGESKSDITEEANKASIKRDVEAELEARGYSEDDNVPTPLVVKALISKTAALKQMVKISVI